MARRRHHHVFGGQATLASQHKSHYVHRVRKAYHAKPSKEAKHWVNPLRYKHSEDIHSALPKMKRKELVHHTKMLYRPGYTKRYERKKISHAEFLAKESAKLARAAAKAAKT